MKALKICQVLLILLDSVFFRRNTNHQSELCIICILSYSKHWLISLHLHPHSSLTRSVLTTLKKKFWNFYRLPCTFNNEGWNLTPLKPRRTSWKYVIEGTSSTSYLQFAGHWLPDNRRRPRRSTIHRLTKYHRDGRNRRQEQMWIPHNFSFTPYFDFIFSNGERLWSASVVQPAYKQNTCHRHKRRKVIDCRFPII